MENQNTLSNEREARLSKLRLLREKNINPYPNIFKPESYSILVKEKFEKENEKEFKTSIAGRIILFRDFGKAVFVTLKDSRGTIQIYARKDVLGDEKFELFKLLDIGDIIGVSGNVFRTHKGEITVLVEEFKLLAKALLGLPEKWHGLTDVETRYRQRYLDLIVNDNVKQNFIIRFKIISFIRKFLESKGFLEVETPMMQTIPGGASARPFITHHNALDMDLYLRIAPELFLKRLIVGGFEKIFELNRNFRNEGIDTKHNPEFTMLELYQAYADYNDMLSLFEEMIKEIAIFVKGKTVIEYQGETIDLANWQKIKYTEALEKFASIDVRKIKTREEAIEIAKQKCIEDLKGFEGKWEIINHLFEEFVEVHLQKPTIIYDYPAEISPLAKYKEDNPEFVERFEAYICGREIANAFSELNDPLVQAERFFEQAKKKAAGDEEAMYVDEDYLTALEYGMPPTGGMGIGIDRLIMFFIDTNSIRETILFPTLKTRN